MIEVAVRHWAFTFNGYGEVDERLVREMSLRPSILVLVCGRERGESGNAHLQGHLGLSAPSRLAAVRLLLPRAHWTPARDVERSIVYCRKGGDMVVDVDKRKPGRRTDIEGLVAALEEGGLPQAKRECPQVLIRYPAGAKLLVSLQDCPDRDDFRVICFIGPAGCGKSRAARTYNPYTWTSGADWFDGYSGENTILLDDFLGSDSGLSLGLFLRIADRGKLRLPVKGGFIVARHTTLVITANTSPIGWYPKANVGAIARRTYEDMGTTYTHPTPFPMASTEDTEECIEPAQSQTAAQSSDTQAP